PSRNTNSADFHESLHFACGLTTVQVLSQLSICPKTRCRPAKQPDSLRSRPLPRTVGTNAPPRSSRCRTQVASQLQRLPDQILFSVQIGRSVPKAVVHLFSQDRVRA